MTIQNLAVTSCLLPGRNYLCMYLSCTGRGIIYIQVTSTCPFPHPTAMVLLQIPIHHTEGTLTSASSSLSGIEQYCKAMLAVY